MKSLFERLSDSSSISKPVSFLSDRKYFEANLLLSGYLQKIISPEKLVVLIKRRVLKIK